MQEKPRIDDEKIIACLQQCYGLPGAAVEFLPIGYDARAGVYRVTASGQPYFLKVKSEAVEDVSVRLPHYLKSQGLEQVVAPLPTVTQALWAKVDHFTVILYPFIDGKNGWDTGLSDQQWGALGAVLKKLHTLPLPPDLRQRIAEETFILQPKWPETMHHLRAAVRDQVSDNPFKKQLAAFWKDHHAEIDHLFDRTVQLSHQLQTRSLDFVLCHADIHLGNVLVDAQGGLFIVDWDQPVIAPRERDLMFVTVGGFVTEKRLETLFFQGYGETTLDPLVMAYYRYERVMEDLVEFAAQVFLNATRDETKQDSIKWFIAQFAPDGPLAAAQALDRVVLLNEASWKFM